jgi:hypothetical protein
MSFLASSKLGIGYSSFAWLFGSGHLHGTEDALMTPAVIRTGTGCLYSRRNKSLACPLLVTDCAFGDNLPATTCGQQILR